MACIIAPPPPVVPTPPPPAAPVPAPPPPTAPVPPGVPQVQVDFANSFVLSDDYSCNATLKLPQIQAAGFKCAAYTATLTLIVQNIGNAAGSMNIGVTANDGGVIITPAGTASVSVPANSYVQHARTFNIGGDGGIGTYEFTVDTGAGQFKFKVVFNGPPPSAGGE